MGSLSICFGLGWAKSHSFYSGQTPVMKYNRQLMQAIMCVMKRISIEAKNHRFVLIFNEFVIISGEP